MAKLIEIAKERRIECLLGLSLKKNKVMVELGRKLGFTVEMFQEDEVALRLEFDQPKDEPLPRPNAAPKKPASRFGRRSNTSISALFLA